MWTTAGLACLGWGWQRLAYLAFIPDRFLTHGYFLTPPGVTARLFMMEAPLELGAVLFAGCLAIGMRSAWRAGARWSLVAC